MESRPDAPEYVEAIYLMMHQDIPEDFVIATGESYSLKEFVTESFKTVNTVPKLSVLGS